MAVLLRHEFPEVDFAKLIRICVIHDLGEAVAGDIPAIDQEAAPRRPPKSGGTCSISSPHCPAGSVPS